MSAALKEASAARSARVIQAARALSAPAAAPAPQHESDSSAAPAPSTPLEAAGDLRDSAAAPASTKPRTGRPRRRLLNLFPESALQPEPAASSSGPQLVFLPRVASTQADPPPPLDANLLRTPPSVDEVPTIAAIASLPPSRRVSTEQVKDELIAAIRAGRGPLVLTAPAATNTASLCSAVIQELDRRTVTALSRGAQSFDELLKMVLVDLGVMTRGSAAHADVPRERLTGALHSFLRSLASLNVRAVVFVDEADRVPAAVLADLQATNAAAERGILQLVLVGRPELIDLLEQPVCHDLAASIAQRIELEPVDAREAHNHVETSMPIASTIVDTPTIADVAPIESTTEDLEDEAPRRSTFARLVVVAAVASLALAGAGALLWVVSTP